MKRTIVLILLFNQQLSWAQQVPQQVMQKVYDDVKTPYKYGMVITPADSIKKIDCPSVFRKGNSWFMTYIQFDGRGYETWIAKSKDLLHWTTLGRIMSFSDTTDWDITRRQDIFHCRIQNGEAIINWKNFRINTG